MSPNCRESVVATLNAESWKRRGSHYACPSCVTRDGSDRLPTEAV